MRKHADAYPIALIVIIGLVIVLLVRSGQDRRIPLCLTGDAQTGLAAVVPPALADTWLDARHMQFAVGSAAIGDWDSLGDALVAGGHAWLRTTRHASPRYYALVSNRYFRSNFLASVPPGTRPVRTVRADPDTTAGQLWGTLARRYPDGVMFEGYAKLRELRSIAIAEPAIRGLAVPANAPHYFTQPMESSYNTWIYVAGFIADNSRIQRRGNDHLARLLPATAGRGHGGRVHLLVLDQPPADNSRAPEPGHVTAVGRLVEDSVFYSAELRLYPVRGVADCAPVYGRN